MPTVATGTHPATGSTGAVPNAADDVAINIAVSASITHSSPASDVAYSVTSQDPITLSAGVLSIVTTADLSASLTLAGGTLAGGTVDLTGGATMVATTAGGTLEGVTLDGTLDMTEADGVSVDVTGGLTLDGSILLGSIYGAFGESLSFIGAQALGGSGTITFGRPSAINTASFGGDSGTLTIGPGIVIDGQSGTIGYNDGGPQTPIINQGTIDCNQGGSIDIYATTLINTGTIAEYGSVVNIDAADTTQAGTLEATDNGDLSIGGIWTDTGPIIDDDSYITLGGSLTLGPCAEISGYGQGRFPGC